MLIVPGLIAIGVAPARTFEDLIPNALAGKLRDHKRMPAFAKRVDLSYALDPRVPVGEVVDALAAIHASGFTAARWIPAAWLPMRFAGGVGSDPIVWQPPPPPPPAVTIAIASVEGKLPSDRTALQIDRVINARAGVFRACYQKELNRTPKLEGTLAVTFQLTDTAVTSATSTGTLRNPGVEACVNSNVMRLRFPAGTPAKLTTTFKFSTTP